MFLIKLEKVLREFNRILQSGGIFNVAVPDVKKIAKFLAGAKTAEEEDWYIRLLHGTQRSEWSHHFCGYVERTLESILSLYGFGNCELLPNINFYPSIYMKAYKLEECGEIKK